MIPSNRWQRLKEAQHPYRRRRPEQSELYRIVSSGREELARIWEDRFQGTYGVLRAEVLSTFDEYLDCGILAHGAARAYCATCKHTLLVAFSCKKRGLCPSCGAKRAVTFAEHLYGTVLEPVPHRHCGFTLPKRLRVYFRYDRTLSGILFRAASIAVQRVLGTDTQTAGLVLTVQTAGEALNFNPHLHGLVTNGTFDETGAFTPVTVIDTELITAHFQDEVLSELVVRGLITDEVPRQLLSQEHTGFGAWVGEPFVEGERTRFVARYIERGPVALDKLTVQDDIVTYITNDGKAHEYDVPEFVSDQKPTYFNQNES
jgi:hypothetical protein